MHVSVHAGLSPSPINFQPSVALTRALKSWTEEPKPADEQDPSATAAVNSADASLDVSGPCARKSMHTAGPTSATVWKSFRTDFTSSSPCAETSQNS